MKERFFNASKLTAAEYIKLMFEATNDGVLHIPHFKINGQGEDADFVEAFIMNWNEDDMKKAISKAEALIAEIKSLADLALSSGGEDKESITKCADFFASEHTYLSSLDPLDIDRQRFDGISKSLLRSEELSDEDMNYYLLIKYKRMRMAKTRIGGKIHYYQVAKCAQKLYKLLLLKAPDLIIQNESRLLGKAMAINAYGESSYAKDMEKLSQALESDPDMKSKYLELRQVIFDKYNIKLQYKPYYMAEDEI